MEVRLVINKNRGWRGLAEVDIKNERNEITSSMVFSFSEDVWQDMMAGYIVLRDPEGNYVIYQFDSTAFLPQGHQRSVLIKNFVGGIVNRIKVPAGEAYSFDFKVQQLIRHFRDNSNKSTTSDWNAIGIRVMPII